MSSSNGTSHVTSLRDDPPINPGAVIVCVDVPDPDNFLMVLRVLKNHENRHVHIVVSPRPVSFAAIPYDTETLKRLGDTCTELGKIGSHIGRITEEDQKWVETLGSDERKWLYTDEDFTDKDVQRDTALYIDVSRIRLLKFLEAHNVPKGRYSLYTNRYNGYKDCPIVPGTHHSLHKPDYSFDFKDVLFKKNEDSALEDEVDSAAKSLLDDRGYKRFNEMREAGVKEAQSQYSVDTFKKVVRSEPTYSDGSKRSSERRSDTRSLCDVYLYMHNREEAGLYFEKRYGTIDALTSNFKGTSIKPMIYVGGPFTEAMKIIRDLEPENIDRVIAMAGATHGKSNLFSNQFNILVHPESAREVLNLATDKELDLTLLPTECAKGSAYDLTWDEVLKIGQKHELFGNLYNQWPPGPGNVTAFDLLAAMAVTTDLYHGMLKDVKYEEVDNKFVFTKLEVEHSSLKGLKMFWNEPVVRDGKAIFSENQYMKDHRKDFLDELEKTLMEYELPSTNETPPTPTTTGSGKRRSFAGLFKDLKVSLQGGER